MTTKPLRPSMGEGGPARTLVVWNHYAVRYELQQPDPGHWTAVGLVTMGHEQDGTQRQTLIVGRGTSEADAIADLRSRAMARCPVPADMHDRFPVEWSTSEGWHEGGLLCSGEDNERC